MTLLWMDGFDHYSGRIESMIKSGYIVSSSNTSHSISLGGRTHHWRFSSFDNIFMYTPRFTDSQTIIVGVAVMRTSFGVNNDNNDIFSLVDEDGNNHVTVRVRRTTSAVLQIHRNGTVLGTGTTVWSTGVWYYVEAKIKINNTAGEFEIKLNGSTEIGPSTSQNTRGGSANDIVRYLGFRSFNQMFLDDLYVLNDQGSRLNGFTGDRRIYLLTPDEDGSTSDYDIVGPAPSRWTAVQGADVENDKRAESFTEDNVHFVRETSTTGTQYFKYPQLHADVDSIEAVMAVSYQKKSLPGLCTSRLKCDSNGSVVDGSTFYPVVEGAWDKMIVQEDPDTSAAWTKSGLDAAQFGVERLS